MSRPSGKDVTEQYAVASPLVRSPEAACPAPTFVPR